MLDVIEKLLILQDRDRKIIRAREQLTRVEPERQALQSKEASTQAGLESAKHRVKQIETDRKKLELDAEAQKAQVAKYSVQQFQTKKNEEYKALAHEIDHCKEAITKLEDQQIELMEQAETAQAQLTVASREADGAKKLVDGQLQNLAARELNLKTELTGLESNRNELTSSIDDGTLSRYERLLKQKGDTAVVGIQHGVCGGCHMKFPPQIVLTCQAGKQVANCPNCGRILYYTRDMDLAVAD